MKLSRNLVLLLCAAVVTITSIGMNSFSLFLKPIEAGFGWSRTMVTVPYMFGMLGWGVGGVLFGKLADDFGARRVILGGILPHGGRFLWHERSKGMALPLVRDHGRVGEGSLWPRDHFARSEALRRKESGSCR